MENRGQKRTEESEELPADKRPCSSLESKPSSSNSSNQSHANSSNSTHETLENDMETSSTSGSSNEEERGRTYSSYDSDKWQPYWERRHSDYHSKFKRVLSCLSEASEESGQLAALTELCELLSFCTDSSVSNLLADSFSPTLVKFARHESNPNIMLLAIRAITYLCDVHPRSSAYLVRHDAVSTLCQRLLAIEYLDVAEQSLQALEKISRDQPLSCLQSGAIMAALSYIDFFSTSLQRVALSTVVNICKKLPSECPLPFMEAVPILCNILQYEDRQLVESCATCLIKITERVHNSSDILDDLCKHGLVGHVTYLIDLNCRINLCQPVYNGLMELLSTLSSGSSLAVKMLFELKISTILKEVLATYCFSHGSLSRPTVDGQNSPVKAVLKLLNVLLPDKVGDRDIKIVSDKEAFLLDRTDLMLKFALDLLPALIQVVNSGVSLCVFYGCLSVINKLVDFGKSNMLLELLKTNHISSFLAGVFTRKDHHVLMLALQIVDTILYKLSDEFLDSFAKEGVLFAVEALITPEKCSQYMFPFLNVIQMPNDPCEKLPTRETYRCLCYCFTDDQSQLNPESGDCKLEKASVYNLAVHIKTQYFPKELLNTDYGLTNVLRKLKILAATLDNLVSTSLETVNSAQHKDTLSKITSELNGCDPISTFELVESGIVTSIVNYLSNGKSLKKKEAVICDSVSQSSIFNKRLEVLGRWFMSSSSTTLEDFFLLALVKKLLNALASMENFPVIISRAFNPRNSFASVPYGRCTSYPCLKVKFVKGKGETFLIDYTEDVVTVDPFCTLDAIGEYLWSRVRKNKIESVKLHNQAFCGAEGCVSPPPGDSTDVMESDSLSLDAQECVDHEQNTSSCNDDIVGTCNANASPKLLFFLEDQPLNHTLSLYQAVVQQQIKARHEVISGMNLWSQVYSVTYKEAIKSKPVCCKHHSTEVDGSSLLDKKGLYLDHMSFFSSFLTTELESTVDISSPIYDILFLLKYLEAISRFSLHLISREKIFVFAEGLINNFDDLRVIVHNVPQKEFVSSKVTEKLEQQMQDPLAISVGGMPSWCSQLMDSCSFLFGFEARCKYFRLAAFDQKVVQQPSLSSRNILGGRNSNTGFPRKKFLVHRDRILESAAKMLHVHVHQKVALEVEYDDEVGTGLGPTLEFYTLVSHEFQKVGLHMWREDYILSMTLEEENPNILVSSFELFPKPWSTAVSVSNSPEFAEVIKKFVLFGKFVAKALQDGRILDIPLSRAFYKLMLGKELTVYDIQSFDSGLCRALIEFLALVERKRYLEAVCGENPVVTLELPFQDTKIEDLCLDFTLPGYPTYILSSSPESNMVNMVNLEEYVLLVVDATINSGISKQMKAFESGFNQVFPIRHLQIFNEDELERLLCGEQEFFNEKELVDHIKFDHGYTASSPPVINLLAILLEFSHEQQRAFLRFVTGAPHLPSGGLASLNPKLTVVRKHCGECVDDDLPSVMTCTNYLKLPPYSSKEKMKEKLLFAITEGQGSFHLS